MNAFASLKQVAPAHAELSAQLRPLSLFGSHPVALADPTGPARADTVAGQLLLAPGTYLVAFQGEASWRVCPRLTVRAVVGGDPRFLAPRVGVEHEQGALAVWDQAELVPGADWDRGCTKAFSAFGLVVIPPGGLVPVELWTAAEDRAVRVELSAVELLAIALGSTQQTESPELATTSKNGAPK